MSAWETRIRFYAETEQSKVVAKALRDAGQFSEVERRSFGTTTYITVKRRTLIQHARDGISAQVAALDLVYRKLLEHDMTLGTLDANTIWKEDPVGQR